MGAMGGGDMSLPYGAVGGTLVKVSWSGLRMYVSRAVVLLIGWVYNWELQRPVARACLLQLLI